MNRNTPADDAVSRVNHTDVVRDLLIAQLTFGKYMPGHSFKLREMMQDEAFQGLSQTPIREALLQLVSQNILMGQRGFSVRVPIPSVEHLTEVREIRTKLEVMAALKIMDTWTAEGIERLEELHQGMLDSKDQGNVQQLLFYNAQFHMALCGMEKKSYLQTMIQTLWAITGPSIGFLYDKGLPKHFDDDHPHVEIIKALKVKDRIRVEAALVHDLNSSGNKILKVLQEKFDPEAPAVRPFEKIELVRNRQRTEKKLQPP